MGFFGNVFRKQFSKNNFCEQFLKTIITCFEEQNSIWEFKYEKQFFWLILHEGTIYLHIT